MSFISRGIRVFPKRNNSFYIYPKTIMLINNFSYTKKRDKFYLYFQAYEGNINIDLLTDWLIDRLIDEIGILT